MRSCNSRTPPQVGAASFYIKRKDKHGRREDSVNLFTDPSQSSHSFEIAALTRKHAARAIASAGAPLQSSDFVCGQLPPRGAPFGPTHVQSQKNKIAPLREWVKG